MQLNVVCDEATYTMVTRDKYIFREVDILLKPSAWEQFEVAQEKETELNMNDFNANHTGKYVFLLVYKVHN